MSVQLEKLIDEQVASLRADEIAGAWRALCGLMLVISASSLRRRARHRKDDVVAARSSLNWLDMDCGVVSFRECCACLDIDTERARSALRSLAAGADGPTRSRVVFGVKSHA